MRFKPRPNQDGLAFPKMKKVKSKPKIPLESDLQAMVESYLKRVGLWYLHVPDEVYRLCSPHNRIGMGTKRKISEAFKGFPDLFIARGGTYLALELKRKGKAPRPTQKAVLKDLSGHSVDNLEDAIDLINQTFGIER